MKGRPRLPRAVKEVRGTLQKCRENPNAPRLKPAAIPDAPRVLTRQQKELWRELKPQVEEVGTYTGSNLTAFRMLVEACSAARYADPRDPPSARVRLLQIASGLLASFGLTPASRDKVSAVKVEGDKAADFLFGGPTEPIASVVFPSKPVVDVQ